MDGNLRSDSPIWGKEYSIEIKGIPMREPLKENFDKAIKKNPLITVTIPNQDCVITNGVMMPKEVIRDGYKSKIGQYVDFDGNSKLVKDVVVTDKYIYVHLE